MLKVQRLISIWFQKRFCSFHLDLFWTKSAIYHRVWRLHGNYSSTTLVKLTQALMRWSKSWKLMNNWSTFRVFLKCKSGASSLVTLADRSWEEIIKIIKFDVKDVRSWSGRFFTGADGGWSVLTASWSQDWDWTQWDLAENILQTI